MTPVSSATATFSIQAVLSPESGGALSVAGSGSPVLRCPSLAGFQVLPRFRRCPLSCAGIAGRALGFSGSTDSEQPAFSAGKCATIDAVSPAGRAIYGSARKTIQKRNRLRVSYRRLCTCSGQIHRGRSGEVPETSRLLVPLPQPHRASVKYCAYAYLSIARAVVAFGNANPSPATLMFFHQLADDERRQSCSQAGATLMRQL